MIYYLLIVEAVLLEPTENVAVVEQGLLPQIFHGRRFKELFIETYSRAQHHFYLQIALSFQFWASQTFSSDH